MTADPGETPTGTADARMAVDLTAAPKAAAADVPPELLAQSLGQYLRAWWLRVRSGNSGVLPVVLAMVVVAVIFEIVTPEHAFLRPSNLVYIFGLSTVYMVLAMAETVVLLLGEIDLSVGAVALIGGVIAFKLVQQPGPAWPWWAAMLAALACCGLIGALQGTLVARLRIPSFVVTLGGFLLFSGILVVVLGGANGTVSVSSSAPNQRVIYDMVQGLIAPVAGWVALAVVVGAVGTALVATRGREATPRPGGSPGQPDSNQNRPGGAGRGGCGDDLHYQPRNLPGDGAGSSVGDPDRPRRPWRLDAPAPADPLRPLRLRHRRQPRGGPPRRRQPRRHPHLGLRVVLGDRRPRRHTARFLFLR